jgi:hypothetical protein
MLNCPGLFQIPEHFRIGGNSQPQWMIRLVHSRLALQGFSHFVNQIDEGRISLQGIEVGRPLDLGEHPVPAPQHLPVAVRISESVRFASDRPLAWVRLSRRLVEPRDL